MQLFPFLLADQASTCFKLLNQVMVVEGEVDVSDLNWRFFGVHLLLQFCVELEFLKFSLQLGIDDRLVLNPGQLGFQSPFEVIFERHGH